MNMMDGMTRRLAALRLANFMLLCRGRQYFLYGERPLYLAQYHLSTRAYEIVLMRPT